MKATSQTPDTPQPGQPATVPDQQPRDSLDQGSPWVGTLVRDLAYDPSQVFGLVPLTHLFPLGGESYKNF